MKKALPVCVVAMTLLGASTAATAQTTAYPESAEPLAQDALHAALADKVFAVTPAQGTKWQFRFKADGRYFLSVGNYSDSGQWTAQNSSLCLNSNRNTGCNEMRQKDGVLYLKRDSGEVVAFQPR